MDVSGAPNRKRSNAIHSVNNAAAVYFQETLEAGSGRAAREYLDGRKVGRQAREQFKLLSLVANETDNSVIICGPDRTIEYVNPGFEKLTGYTMDEVRGKKPGFFDFVGAAKYEAWEKLAGTPGEDARGEYVDLVRKLGGDV